MLYVAHQLNAAANSIFAAKKCCKNTAAKSNQFDFCFLTIKYTFEIRFTCGPHVNKCLQKILCSLYNNMSSLEQHNKLADEEKLKLIELYKENSELWVTEGITRILKALKKE